MSKSQKRLWMRTKCRECGWEGEWVRTPNETLQLFASHLLDTHPGTLRDPVKLKAMRIDEFDTR